MALVPYIKPSKFHPHLSSWDQSPHPADHTDDKIFPLWDPNGVRVTTWKRVEPPTLPYKTTVDVFKDPEERLQNLNKTFKDTIEGLERGFLYNELRRKVESSLDEGKPPVEGEPLLYFKYDFGYEFGIADPRSVIISTSTEGNKGRMGSTRALAPPPQDEDVIHLPVIHETKKE